MDVQKTRNNSLDLLRIISMMMVVSLHFFGHGGLVCGALVEGTANWYLGESVHAFSIVAVNCFVLLSGYFQCTSKFKLKRLVSVWAQVLFYSVTLYILTALISGSFSVMVLIKSGLVVTMRQYWFVTAYLLMYAVSPFLNCAIRAMNQKMHLLCCCVLMGIFSVLHNLVYISDFGNVLGGSSFLWFCVLYIVVAYIRFYVPTETKHRKCALAVYAVCVVLIAGERFAAYWITPKIFGQVLMESLFYSNNSILTTAAAISLFMAMRTVSVKRRVLARFVDFFAPLAFGVYLIHDHANVRPMLWSLLKPYSFAESPWMIPYCLLCVAGIFTACCLIEWVRQQMFRLCGIKRLVERCCDRIQGHVQAWLGAEA